MGNMRSKAKYEIIWPEKITKEFYTFAWNESFTNYIKQRSLPWIKNKQNINRLTWRPGIHQQVRHLPYVGDLREALPLSLSHDGGDHPVASVDTAAKVVFLITKLSAQFSPWKPEINAPEKSEIIPPENLKYSPLKT